MLEAWTLDQVRQSEKIALLCSEIFIALFLSRWHTYHFHFEQDIALWMYVIFSASLHVSWISYHHPLPFDIMNFWVWYVTHIGILDNLRSIFFFYQFLPDMLLQIISVKYCWVKCDSEILSYYCICLSIQCNGLS